MTYTQGPWRVTGESGNDSESEIIEASDKTIAWTASSYDDVDGEEYISDEDLANARLIAASPDLLLCLQNLVDRGLIVNDNDHYEECITAIARATGAEVEA